MDIRLSLYRLTQLSLGLSPCGLAGAEDHDRLQNLLYKHRRAREGANLSQVLLVQGLQGLGGEGKEL